MNIGERHELEQQIESAKRTNDAITLQGIGEELLERASDQKKRIEEQERALALLKSDCEEIQALGHRVLAAAGRAAEDAGPDESRQRFPRPSRRGPKRAWQKFPEARLRRMRRFLVMSPKRVGARALSREFEIEIGEAQGFLDDHKHLRRPHGDS